MPEKTKTKVSQAAAKPAAKAPPAKKKAAAKKKLNAGQAMACEVCGLSVTIDEVGGEVVEQDTVLLCCGKPMQEKAVAAKAAVKKAAVKKTAVKKPAKK